MSENPTAPAGARSGGKPVPVGFQSEADAFRQDQFQKHVAERAPGLGREIVRGLFDLCPDESLSMFRAGLQEALRILDHAQRWEADRRDARDFEMLRPERVDVDD